MSVLYFGLAFVFNFGWPLVLWPAALLSLYRLVIRREEQYLADAFEGEYADYRRTVGRWL